MLGLEEKGSLRPKMEKTLYSLWIWMEGALKRVSFFGLYGLLGGRHRRGRKLGRILLKGKRCRIIPGSILTNQELTFPRIRSGRTRHAVPKAVSLLPLFIGSSRLGVVHGVFPFPSRTQGDQY